jgi:hypothetical protein
MATDDEPFDYGSLPEETQQEFLYEVIGFHDAGSDTFAHDLFYNAFYNDDITMDNRLDLMEQLNDHLWEAYGVDFEAIWDWEDFREWYGNN